MKRLARPAGAIEDAAALKVGDHIWKVYGIWPPFLGGEHVVVSAPAPFSQHEAYQSVSVMGDHTVFDTRELKHGGIDMNFAGDGNLVPGKSSNNNYWFRSAEAAEVARAHLHAEWQKNPEMIQDEIARRREDRERDRAFG